MFIIYDILIFLKMKNEIISHTISVTFYVYRYKF